MPEQPITAAQRAAFWRHFSAACQAQGIPADEREAYRRAVLREEGGVEHLADLGRTHGFDAVCLRLCLDADDYDGAARYEVGDARRMGAIVESVIREIVAGTPTAPEAYLRGVFAHAHMPFPGTEESRSSRKTTRFQLSPRSRPPWLHHRMSSGLRKVSPCPG